MNKFLVPSRRQWHSWSLPSKLTAIGTLLGAIALVIALLELFPSSGTAPDLYLTLSDKESIDWSFEQADTKPVYPIESTIFEAVKPTSFSDCILSSEPRSEGIFSIAAKAFILNTGDKKATNVWFRVFVDPVIFVWVIGTDEWNTGTSNDTGDTVLSFKGNKNYQVGGRSIEPALGMIAIRVPPIPRAYELRYVIGADEMPLRERNLTVEVRTSYVPVPYIDNAKGLEMLARSEPATALEHFRKALSSMPDFGAFHFNAGTALLKLGKFEEAEVFLLRSTELSPEAYETWGNLGACYLAQERPKKAIPVIQRALEINPKSQLDQSNLEHARSALVGKARKEQ